MIGPAPKESGAARCNVGAGHDPDDARQRLRLRGADRDDARVGVLAADDRRVRHAGQADVVDVAALAAEEARVLDPVDALPSQRRAGLLERRLGRDPCRRRELLDARPRRHGLDGLDDLLVAVQR